MGHPDNEQSSKYESKSIYHKYWVSPETNYLFILFGKERIFIRINWLTSIWFNIIWVVSIALFLSHFVRFLTVEYFFWWLQIAIWYMLIDLFALIKTDQWRLLFDVIFVVLFADTIYFTLLKMLLQVKRNSDINVWCSIIGSFYLSQCIFKMFLLENLKMFQFKNATNFPHQQVLKKKDVFTKE